MEIFDSRYFVINKNLLTIMGLWPYQNGKKKICIRICVTLIIFVGIIVPQVRVFTVHLNLHVIYGYYIFVNA